MNEFEPRKIKKILHQAIKRGSVMKMVNLICVAIKIHRCSMLIKNEKNDHHYLQKTIFSSN